MNWLDRLERRFHGNGIPNVVNILLAGQLAVGVIALFFQKDILSLCYLSRYLLFSGQIWRLVTFLFYPTWLSGILGIFSLLFYWWAGQALQHVWGDFRLTFYLLLGTVGAWLSCLFGGVATVEGILLSLFFAYAWMWPEQQVLLFGIVPLKVKYLGWFELAIWGLEFITGGIGTKISLLCELLGFLVFFGKELTDWVQDSISGYKRRQDWNRKNR